MNEYQKLIELEQKIKNKFESLYGQTNGISILVTDTVYYRTFQLRDFFEFNEHVHIEPGSIQFHVEIMSSDGTYLLTFRLHSCELDEAIAIIRITRNEGQLLEPCLELLDILLPALNFKLATVVAIQPRMVKSLIANNFKEAHRYQNYGSSECFIFNKSIND